MKPITIICQCLLLTTVALGQGSVFFRNKILGQAGGVDVPFFDDQGVPLEGSNYVAQLYAWNEGDGFQPVGAPVPFATNGYFYGAEVVVPFVQGCSPAWVQVLAWEAQGGTTFDQAALAGAWTGVSGSPLSPPNGQSQPPRGMPGGPVRRIAIPWQSPGSTAATGADDTCRRKIDLVGHCQQRGADGLPMVPTAERPARRLDPQRDERHLHHAAAEHQRHLLGK